MQIQSAQWKRIFGRRPYSDVQLSVCKVPWMLQQYATVLQSHLERTSPAQQGWGRVYNICRRGCSEVTLAVPLQKMSRNAFRRHWRSYLQPVAWWRSLSGDRHSDRSSHYQCCGFLYLSTPFCGATQRQGCRSRGVFLEAEAEAEAEVEAEAKAEAQAHSSS